MRSATGSNRLDGNDVVRKRIADDLSVDDPRRARIVDRVLHDRPAEGIGPEHATGQRRAEVAVPVGVGRHRGARAGRVRPVAEHFQVGEEECLVPPVVEPGDDDGTAAAEPEVVLAAERPRAGKRSMGVERLVGHVVVEAAVQVVGPRLGGEVEDAAQHLTVLGREVGGLHRELADGLDRRGGYRARPDRVVRAGDVLPFEVDLERAPWSAVHAGAFVGPRHARRQGDESQPVADRSHVAAASAEIQRQLVDPIAR